MKTLSCRDAGCDCDYVAKGETEEDVLRDAAQHGMKEHGRRRTELLTSPKSTRIDWKRVIARIKEELPWFQERDIKPTLRTLFYRLVSLEVIPNTNQAYKRLSNIAVTARKKGKLSWVSFSDEGRIVLADFSEEYHTPEQFVQLHVRMLKNASQNYTVPRWYKQPNYVEVWIEKQALADTFSSFLRGRDVRIVVNRGYSGWSFLYDNSMRLLKAKESGKEIHILYFGDFDPSGDNMEDHLDKAFVYFGLEDIDFQRVAVTEEQIEEFNLPHMPNNKETIEKVDHDTRKNGFIRKYGKLYIVELDALLAIVPDEFKLIVQESVDQFFDTSIYQDVLSDNQPQTVDRLIRERVSLF
jgi:predicted small metal-binding protein